MSVSLVAEALNTLPAALEEAKEERGCQFQWDPTNTPFATCIWLFPPPFCAVSGYQPTIPHALQSKAFYVGFSKEEVSSEFLHSHPAPKTHLRLAFYIALDHHETRESD
jgi:hypothetical protein